MAPKIFTTSFYRSLTNMPREQLFRTARPYLSALAVTAAALFLLFRFWGSLARYYGCDMMSIELWRDGEVRTSSCDWYEGKEQHSLYCSYYPDGRQAGCGRTVEGLPWDGIHVEWWRYDDDTPPARGYGVPAAVRSFERGQPVGVWRFYRRSGMLLKEQWFEDGLPARVVSYDGEEKMTEEQQDNEKGE